MMIWAGIVHLVHHVKLHQGRGRHLGEERFALSPQPTCSADHVLLLALVGRLQLGQDGPALGPGQVGHPQVLLSRAAELKDVAGDDQVVLALRAHPAAVALVAGTVVAVAVKAELSLDIHHVAEIFVDSVQLSADPTQLLGALGNGRVEAEHARHGIGPLLAQTLLLVLVRLGVASFAQTIVGLKSLDNRGRGQRSW